MFSDESCFQIICNRQGTVRPRTGSDRNCQKYSHLTVKHPDSVMIWACFSGNGGRGGLFFLPKGQKMNSIEYKKVLENHLLQFMDIHGSEIFQQDGAPCHTSKMMKSWFQDSKIELLDWPGNSPDLNPIENVWAIMKRRLQGMTTSSIGILKDEI